MQIRIDVTNDEVPSEHLRIHRRNTYIIMTTEQSEESAELLSGRNGHIEFCNGTDIEEDWKVESASSKQSGFSGSPKLDTEATNLTYREKWHKITYADQTGPYQIKIYANMMNSRLLSEQALYINMAQPRCTDNFINNSYTT